MNRYENAIKLMEERCGNSNKGNLIALETIALPENSEGEIRPSARMVDAYYEDGIFYVSTDARKRKMQEYIKYT